MIKDEITSTQVLNHASIQPPEGRQLQEVQTVDHDDLNAPAQGGLNLRPFLRTVQRKAVLITVITGVVSCGALLSSKRTLPTYEGKFRLLVEPANNEAKSSDPNNISRSQGEPSLGVDYPTQLEILRSPKMLKSIVEQIKVREPKYKNLNTESLQKSLMVERLGKTELDQTKIIEVSYKDSDPKLTYLVLQVTADKYLKYSLDERKSRINAGIKFIDEQVPSLRKRVDGLRLNIQSMQQQYRLTDTKAQGTELLTQLRLADTQQAETQRQLLEQKTLYANLQKQLDIKQENQAIAASTLSENPRYQEVLAKLKEVEIQIAVESARFQPDSPNIEVLQEKRKNLSSLLNQETQRILGQKIPASTANNSPVTAFQNSIRVGLIKQMVDTVNQIKILEIRNQGVAQSRNVMAQQVQLFPAIARRYNEIQEQLDIANKTLDQLLNQRETLGVEAAQKQLPWELISPPRIPTDLTGKPMPDAQDSKKMLMTGVALGLVLGMGTAFLIEKLRNIFYTAEDIKDATRLPLLGEIPLYKSTGKFRKSTEIVDSLREIQDSNYGDHPFLDAFDSLYASIRFLFSTQMIRSLAVCSAEAGDGKSTIALHLAQTVAAMGQRVLLVDANLRAPQLHTMLDLPNLKGLSDLLANKLAPNDTIQRSLVTDNLFVLTSGQPLPESTRMLASAQMKFLVESFKETFDLVIYDTPPILGPLDASFLAAHTDGILLVVAVGKTRVSKVEQALTQLKTFNLQSLGVIANHVGKNRNRSSGYTTATVLKTKKGIVSN